MLLRGKGLFFLTVMNGPGFYYGFVFGSRNERDGARCFLKRVSNFIPLISFRTWFNLRDACFFCVER